MKKILLAHASIINQNEIFMGSILVHGTKIQEVFRGSLPESFSLVDVEVIDCNGKYIIPGVIDDQVHFREPGLTHKGSIASESMAAVAGGITSYMEMPNVVPQTTTIDLLHQKFEIAERDSYANYSFYLGATNDNIDQLRALDARTTCGVKVFMGSSTGNMLVDNIDALSAIFKDVRIPIATHCEDEQTIQHTIAEYTKQYGDDIPISCHPLIRSREACFLSSSLAVSLAKKYNSRLHVLHLSTADELALFESGPASQKQITAEVCVHHLWFTQEDYESKAAFIKWNPSIKTKNDRDQLRNALKNNILDVVATDHAPHTIAEKTGPYKTAASGGPLVQHALVAMLDLYKQGIFSLEQIVTKMCHAPADIFGVSGRGYLQKGMFADIVVIDMEKPTSVTEDSLLYKCAWSPFTGHSFSASVEKTFVNGALVYDSGKLIPHKVAQALEFSR